MTSSTTKERIFPSWQMGAKKIDLEKIEYKTDMTSEEQKEFGRILSGHESNIALSLIKKFFK